MKRVSIFVVLLALASLSFAQADPRLISTPTGYDLRPGTTVFSGLLGDLFTKNFGQLPAGGPPLGNFVVPCNQSGTNPIPIDSLGPFTGGCVITDVSGNAIYTGTATGGTFFQLVTAGGSTIVCLDNVEIGCNISFASGHVLQTVLRLDSAGTFLADSNSNTFNTTSTGTAITGGPFTAPGVTDDGSTGLAVCWVTATTLGHCTSAVAVDGSCTCS